MQQSNIGWTDYTWNPVTGCSKVSEGCKNCWAERFSHRQGWTDDPWTEENARSVVTTHQSRLDEPQEYHFPDGPGRIAVALMGDLFHPQVPNDFIRDVLRVVAYMPEHEFQFLTKRPERVVELPINWPDNAIVGTTVECEDRVDRIDQLREVDARRWISFEPLIGPVGDIDLTGIDWVVVGGESGPKDERRELNHEWAESVLKQARAAEIPFYFKQDSGRFAEQSEYLTVTETDTGLPAQKKIREHPRLPESVRMARGRATPVGE